MAAAEEEEEEGYEEEAAVCYKEELHKEVQELYSNFETYIYSAMACFFA